MSKQKRTSPEEGYQIALKRIRTARLSKSRNLALVDLNLSKVPNEIIDLSGHLVSLDLAQNSILDITFMAQFKNLKKLSIWSNKVKDISSIKELNKLEVLNLHRNGIVDISCLSKLTNLKELAIGYNPILDITPIKNLIQIQELHLARLQVSEIEFLSEFKELEELYLHDNTIIDISPLDNLKKLRYINISSNRISNISKSFFKNKISVGFHLAFEGNPLQSPPVSVLEAGQQAILDYFDKLEREGKDYLYEAKLLVVGEGGSGKTTFRLKIQNTNAPMPDEKDSTKGIDICPLQFTTRDGKKIQLNMWDFGGQEIYHQTHQFFLTHKSLYILLTDNRKQDTDFNWWLDTIQAFGGNSPILIVQNEKGDRVVDLNMKEITERYKEVKQALPVNFESTRGVDEMRKIVYEWATKLDHMGDELPKSWVNIRKEIEKLAQKYDYVSIEKYLQVCAQNGITDKAEALRLCSVYHNLGVLLHFSENAVLKHTIILRNDWATDAVYKMLDDRTITDAKGRFVFEDCARVWNEPKYRDKRHEILELMLKFDLCYKMRDTQQYILPQLLPTEQPDYNWDDTDNVQVTYKYGKYMPKGLVNRLMARLNWYTDLNRSWKTGTIFTKQGAIAEVREPYGEKEISVRISGANKRDLLLFIDEELQRIHKNYANINVNKWVGCVCSQCTDSKDKKLYDFEKLRARMKAGKETIECDKSYEDIEVGSLMTKTFGIPENEQYIFGYEKKEIKKLVLDRVFISYSKADKDYRDRLVLYLQQFERNGLIGYWSDKELVAGEKWDAKIKTELENADIVLFLCSQDMLGTKYIQDVEMKRAFEREKEGKVKIVPIIVKPCTWAKDLQLPEYTALPTKGIPIIDKSWGDPDYAYMNIYEGLEKLLKSNQQL